MIMKRTVMMISVMMKILGRQGGGQGTYLWKDLFPWLSDGS